MPDIFLCHSESDSDTVAEIARGLEDVGFKTWYYERDTVPGLSYLSQVVDSIDDCKVILVLISPDSMDSRQVSHELTRGQEGGKVFIPVLCGITYRELVKRSPAMSQVLEGVTAIKLQADAVSEIIPRLLEGLGKLGLYPPAPSGRVRRQKSLDEEEVKTGTPEVEYEVFLSYRRQDGAAIARLISSELQKRQFKVFLDVVDLRPGHFDESLLSYIESSRNFVLILTPRALDGCKESGDWLRQEISHAIRCKANIVPIIMPGFNFPETNALPDDIRSILKHHCLSYSHEFFDAMIDKLVDYLK